MPPLIIAAIISGGVALVTTGAGVISKETTDCGKACRAKCKNETGWLFGGRNECKKKCKDKCLNSLSPQEQEAERKKEESSKKVTNAMYVGSAFLFLIAIGLVIYWLAKKK